MKLYQWEKKLLVAYLDNLCDRRWWAVEGAKLLM